MKRDRYKKLLEWKGMTQRMPLMVRGARQVGKTYLLKEFGKNEFVQCHYLNFEKDKTLMTIFEQDFYPERIVSEISIRIGKKINIQTDLLVFDEIQECPKAMTSLKYFCEDMPELALCSAGSLLGVKLSSESFPVGKVQFLDLFPFSFEEFLNATGDEMTQEIFHTTKYKDQLSEISHQKLLTELINYYFTGGMPKVLEVYQETRRLGRFDMIQAVRAVQRDVVDGYSKDFAKHSGKINSMHIMSVFENIPMQLAKSMKGSAKRYYFKDVIPKKKSFSDLQGPINWLEKAGLIIKTKICNKPQIPFESFCKQNLFKLYLFDVGLLGCMLNLPGESIFGQDFGSTKGYYAENYVAMQLVSNGLDPLYSWTERNSEIEFLSILKGQVVPLEVKSGIRTQAKSLKVFMNKYDPNAAVVFSTKRKNNQKSSVIKHIPLYWVGRIKDFV